MDNLNKKTATNYLYTILTNVLNLIFPLITYPYVLRIFSVENIGMVNFANTIVQYFVLVAGLGLPVYGIKIISREKRDPIQLNKAFTELMIIKIIFTLITSVVFLITIMSVDSLRDNILIYFVLGLQVFTSFISLEWFYQGMEKFRFIAQRNLMIKIINLVLTYTLIQNGTNIVVYAIIITINVVGINVANVLSLKKYVKPSIHQINIKKHLKPLFFIFASVFAIELYTHIDITILGILSNEENVAYYSVANRISRILLPITISLTTVLYPQAAKLRDDGDLKKYHDASETALGIILCMSMPIMIGMLLLAPEIIMLFGGMKYLPAVDTLRILSVIVILVGFINFFGKQVLLVNDKEKSYMYSFIFGAIINIVLSVPLIIRFSHNGAAFASVISETVVLLVIIHYSKKIYKLPKIMKQIINYLICSVFLVIVYSLFSRIVDSNIIIVVGTFIIGGTGYVLIGIFILKDKYLSILRDGVIKILKK